jgi:acyl-CoA reductase-like NAD-dependent aldehyde dehydrogenase
MKTAEQTPLSAMRVAELAAEVGFPPGGHQPARRVRGDDR